jgi:hypothetical protein
VANTRTTYVVGYVTLTDKAKGEARFTEQRKAFRFMADLIVSGYAEMTLKVERKPS